LCGLVRGVMAGDDPERVGPGRAVLPAHRGLRVPPVASAPGRGGRLGAPPHQPTLPPPYTIETPPAAAVRTKAPAACAEPGSLPDADPVKTATVPRRGRAPRCMRAGR